MDNSYDMDRRGMLERMAALVGAAAAGALSPAALAKAAAGPQRYLDAPNFTLLSAVADTIVPRTDTAGAVDAGVPATVDALLLNWASGERRYALTRALARIEAKARAQQGKGFAELAPDARYTLLDAHDVEALAVDPNAPKLSGLAGLMAGPAVADRGYAKLKELIVLAYYMSEPALTQELAYEHAPGEWQPSIPVTPETRPAAGTTF